MEEKNIKIIDNEKKNNIKNNVINNFNKYSRFCRKDKNTIQSYLFKKKYDIIKFPQKNNFLNYNNSLDNSTKINSIPLNNSNNLIKTKLEESKKSIEPLLNKTKAFSKPKIINLKHLLYSPNLKSGNDNYTFYTNNKNSPIINEKNKNYNDVEDLGSIKNLTTKIKLDGNAKYKEKKYNKLNKKYFSLTNIQNYNNCIKFKSIKKTLFNNKEKNNIINDISIMNKTHIEFMKNIKNINGVYSLPKIYKPISYKYRKNLIKKQIDKTNKLNKNNSHLDIFNNLANIKTKINKENKKMNTNIKNIYSKLNIIKNYLNTKRPNENTHKGLEKLFYLYNKKRAKEEKIITNRMINDNNNIQIEDLEEIDKENYKKKLNIINEKNITHIAQNKVNKIFHDLLIFQLPKLTDKKYIRKVLYDIFIEFKNLLLISMVINKDINIYKKGIDFSTFFNCNTFINQQGKIVAKKVFDIFNNKMGTKYMNLDNYINGMLKFKDTNKENKLDLFFEMLNNNSDGYLTYNDIYKLSLVCLQKITLNIEDEIDYEKYKKEHDDKDLKIIEGLAEYFCKMIFKLVNIDINEKIPLKLLKKMIIQGGEQADYIELLFGSSNFT